MLVLLGNRVAPAVGTDPTLRVLLLALVILLSACRGAGTGDEQDAARPSAGVADGAAVAEATSLRCSRLDYVCSWSDVEEGTLQRVEEVFDRVQAAIDGAADPAAGITAAVEILSQVEDVVEVIPDVTLHTSVLFRLEGAPEAVAFTELAAPLGDLPIEERDERAAGVGGEVAVTPTRFEPAGGPLTPKQALVLDPYGKPGAGCHEAVGDGQCFITPKGRSEGAAVAAIMAADPQITVDYLHADNPTALSELLRRLPDYDLVHLATHGSSNCNDSTAGWLTGVPDRAPPEGLGGIENQVWDPDECYSVSAIAPLYLGGSGGNATLPPGLAYNDTHWLATTDFWVGRFSEDAIVYFSHCTAGDGQLAKSDTGGAFVGWHSYARIEVAQDAAISFWRDMVSDGVSFETATDHLVEQDLHWSVTAGPKGYSRALLGARGENLRARDVITTYVGGAELDDGAVIPTDGTVGDGANETVPEVRFLVEGVAEGRQGRTTIEVLLDDEPLRTTLNVEKDGEVVAEGEGWNAFEVAVVDLDLDRDLTAADVDATSPAPHRWEVRVYEDRSQYSAHAADPVYFGGQPPVCDVVEPNRGRLLDAFGSTVPFDEVGSEGTENSCVINLAWPDNCCLPAYVYFERLPAAIGSVARAAEQLDGAAAPLPELGDDAVVIEDPLGMQPHVLFSFGGRVYDVRGEYGADREGEAPPSAIIETARVFRDLLAGSLSPESGEPVPDGDAPQA